jgi:hypothetical protein
MNRVRAPATPKHYYATLALLDDPDEDEGEMIQALAEAAGIELLKK